MKMIPTKEEDPTETKRTKKNGTHRRTDRLRVPAKERARPKRAPRPQKEQDQEKRALSLGRPYGLPNKTVSLIRVTLGTARLNISVVLLEHHQWGGDMDQPPCTAFRRGRCSAFAYRSSASSH